MKLVEVHVEKFRNFDDSEVVANREFERSVYESLAPMIHAIALWRYGQGVYRFDDHLAAELLDTPLSSGLPAEVLTRLPEWCPLIVAPRCEGWPSEFAGVFVCHSWNASAKRRELRLVYIPTQVATPLISILPLNAATLGEALDMWRDQIMRDAGEKGRDRKELETLFTQSRAVVTKALGLVLYLCAENAEIQALDGQSPPVAQPTEPSVSHRHRELLVGYRTGPLLAGRQRSDRSVEARGHSPEPHLRRAHWHHYWVGAADDPERRLELRWISPTLVGGRPERLRVRDLDSRR